MPRTTTINVTAPARDARPRPRKAISTRDLARQIRETADKFVAVSQRIDEAAARAEALRFLLKPTPAEQAVRDRAALQQGWRDQVERDRAKLRKMQSDADAFYRRVS